MSYPNSHLSETRLVLDNDEEGQTSVIPEKAVIPPSFSKKPQFLQQAKTDLAPTRTQQTFPQVPNAAYKISSHPPAQNSIRKQEDRNYNPPADNGIWLDQDIKNGMIRMVCNQGGNAREEPQSFFNARSSQISEIPAKKDQSYFPQEESFFKPAVPAKKPIKTVFDASDSSQYSQYTSRLPQKSVFGIGSAQPSQSQYTRQPKYQFDRSSKTKVQQQRQFQSTYSRPESGSKIKKKINIISSQKLSETFGLSDNTNWIRHLNNPSLEWKNAKDAPLEIKIMLNKLSLSVDATSVSKLQTTRPVSQALPFTSRLQSYKNSNLYDDMKRWSKQFPTFRQIRGDGNCFYRAFNFGFLEMALTQQSSLHFLKFLSIISNPAKVTFKTNKGNTLINNNKQTTAQHMRRFVVHRLLLLYSYRVSLAEKNDEHWEQKIIKVLENVFNQSPFCFDAYLIIALKNLIITELDSKEELQDFENIKQLKEEIMKFGFECELNQLPIKALSDALEVNVSLFQEIGAKCSFNQLGSKSNEKVILYYRTGHYDIAYPYKRVYEELA